LFGRDWPPQFHDRRHFHLPVGGLKPGLSPEPFDGCTAASLTFCFALDRLLFSKHGPASPIAPGVLPLPVSNENNPNSLVNDWNCGKLVRVFLYENKKFICGSRRSLVDRAVAGAGFAGARR
jgi:hypothetical protein